MNDDRALWHKIDLNDNAWETRNVQNSGDSE